MSSKIQYDASKASQVARVPARQTTQDELNVVIKWNTPSQNPIAPVGTAIAMTPACTYEIAIFKSRDGAGYSLSTGRNYLSASIPADLNSAILEKVEALIARQMEITVTGYLLSRFATPRGAQKGYLQLQLEGGEKISSLRYGVSNRTGKAYLMPAENFVASDTPVIESIEEGTFLNGRYSIVKDEAGTIVAKKNDVRAGGVSISPAIYDFCLELVTEDMTKLGYISGPKVIGRVEETEDVEDKELVSAI